MVEVKTLTMDSEAIMFKEIERIDYKNFDYEDFITNYWLKEKPVIISNVSITNQYLTVAEIKKQFQKSSSKQAGWYDAISDESLTPTFVKDLMQRDEISTREENFRVFLQPGGHKTLTHYDGNSIHGLNLQYRGLKEWIIISPNTPLRNIPFMYIVMKGELIDLPKNVEAYKFKTKPGDLLFLPRYWQHQVNSLGEVNINLNWVGTPRYPGNSKLAKRENDIILLREKIPIINKAFFPEPINRYGGEGKELTRNYTTQTNYFSILIRLTRELSNYLFLPLYYRTIRKRANMFIKNNFNV